MIPCPNCGETMATKEVAASFASQPMEIDACATCRLFWFDSHESTSLAPRATLGLFEYIGTASRERVIPLSSRFDCPRCHSRLDPTHDLQRTTSFTYWRCDFSHGKLISFNQFLREKNFIRTPSPAELAKMRETVKQVSCSQCGAPIDLEKASACDHCGAPIALIDPDSVTKALQQLSTTSGLPGPEVTRAAILDAQIDAWLEHQRQWVDVEKREERVDMLEIGVQAIGGMIGAFLTMSRTR